MLKKICGWISFLLCATILFALFFGVPVFASLFAESICLEDLQSAIGTYALICLLNVLISLCTVVLWDFFDKAKWRCKKKDDELER